MSTKPLKRVAQTSLPPILSSPMNSKTYFIRNVDTKQVIDQVPSSDIVFCNSLHNGRNQMWTMYFEGICAQFRNYESKNYLVPGQNLDSVIASGSSGTWLYFSNDKSHYRFYDPKSINSIQKNEKDVLGLSRTQDNKSQLWTLEEWYVSRCYGETE